MSNHERDSSDGEIVNTQNTTASMADMIGDCTLFIENELRNHDGQADDSSNEDNISIDLGSVNESEVELETGESNLETENLDESNDEELDIPEEEVNEKEPSSESHSVTDRSSNAIVTREYELDKIEEIKKIKRAQSAWMFFLNDKRDEIQPGLRVGEVTKAVSLMWSSLSIEERAIYEAKATDDKARLNRELEKMGLSKLPSNSNRNDGKDLPPDQTFQIILPLSRIRKTVKMDSDVKNVSLEALVLIAKTTELFLARFATKTWGIVHQMRRKNLRLVDMQECVDTDGSLIFLRDEFSEVEKNKAKSVVREKSLAAPPEPEKDIARFFIRTEL